MNKLDSTVTRLCAASQNDFQNPFSLEWPDAIEMNQWFMSPELSSLYGTELYEELDTTARKRVSFYECINFFSLNINGERALIEGIANRLYRKKHSAISRYLHHFLDEENKHMVLFGTFCSRYAGKVYGDRKISFSRDFSPGEEDFLFFAKVMIFEELADAYNLRMGVDGRLEPLAQKINLLHHKDEARHLVFGRQLVAKLFAEYAPSWSEETLTELRSYIANYLTATWKEYYNPTVYEDAGFPDPYAVCEFAWSHPASVSHRQALSKNVVAFLLKNKILIEEPLI